MSVELHCRTRGDLRPDPQSDEVCGVFYSVFNDVPPDAGPRHAHGAVVVDPMSASRAAVHRSQDEA